MRVPEGIDPKYLYPSYTRDFTWEHPDHEWQVRYLRDAMTVCFSGYEVTGNTVILGWDGRETVYSAPDVLVRWFAGRHDPPNPHPNPHPFERERRFEFAIDVVKRESADEAHAYLEPADLAAFGLSAYVRFNMDSRILDAWRLVDWEPVPVRADCTGKYLFADYEIGFQVENSGFLRICGWDGKFLPSYQEIVKAPPTAAEASAEIQAKLRRARAEQL